MLEKLIDPISNILDKFVADKDLKQKLEHELKTELHRANMAQIEVNKEEAKGNWFQAGWRPACAWVCVAGFTVNFLISPLAEPFGVVVPQADISTMMPVLLGMLGLAGARSFERVKKVGKN